MEIAEKSPENRRNVAGKSQESRRNVAGKSPESRRLKAPLTWPLLESFLLDNWSCRKARLKFCSVLDFVAQPSRSLNKNFDGVEVVALLFEKSFNEIEVVLGTPKTPHNYFSWLGKEGNDFILAPSLIRCDAEARLY